MLSVPMSTWKFLKVNSPSLISSMLTSESGDPHGYRA